MKHLSFWFDPISPFAYLAFERLPQALLGISHTVNYRPVLFAGLLNHWGQKGPAEIEPKRTWTFRHTLWMARQHGIAMQMPVAHPFNPLGLLRLAIAAAPEGGTPNRLTCERILRHVWQGGADATDPQRLADLSAALSPVRDPNADEIKRALRSATDEAIALGLFGVPTIEVDGHLFWGVESLPMLAQYLRGDAAFDPADWAEGGAPRPGVARAMALPNSQG